MFGIKDVLVLAPPVGPRRHSLSMDLRVYQNERRSATDQKILPLNFMPTTAIQLTQNRHRCNRQASGGVYSNGNIEGQPESTTTTNTIHTTLDSTTAIHTRYVLFHDKCQAVARIVKAFV